MHILYFHQHFTTPSGSGATRSYEFAKGLVVAGHRVTMVCGLSSKANLDLPLPGSDGTRRGIIDGIDVIAFPLRYSNHDGILRRAIVFLRYAFGSVRLALREDYDLVFATSTPLTAAIPGVVASWFRRKPFVFEVRDLWPELPRAMGMRNPIILASMWVLEWLAYRSSVACVGLAPGIVGGIARRARKGHPIIMIPNGCDLELFDPAARASLEIVGIHPGDFVAGFTGAHGKANGLDAVLDVARELRRRGVGGIKILLVGDGSEKRRLEHDAAEERLDNVVFHAPMPKRDLAAVTASLDCGLMVLSNIPAFYQGTSPNKFFDYISAGIPVVTNYPGWIADIIAGEQVGIAVPPSDPAAFADALIFLKDRRDARLAMGRRARALAAAAFSRPTATAKFVRFIEAFAPVRPG